jgi:hypothetical protein
MTISKYTDGETIDALRQNQNIWETHSLDGKNLIRTLMDRSVTFSKGFNDYWGDAYTSETGRMGSIPAGSGSTATFDTNKYRTPPVDATITITGSNADAVSDERGWQILAKTDISGLVVTKQPSSVTTGCKIYLLGGAMVAQTTWSGNTATFTGLSLVSGNTYTVVAVHAASTAAYRDTGSAGQSTAVFNSLTNGAIGNASSGSNLKYDVLSIVATSKVSTSYTIVQTIPFETFSSPTTAMIGVPMIQDWETGANIQYQLEGYGGDGADDTDTFIATQPVTASTTNARGFTVGVVGDVGGLRFSKIKNVTKHTNCTATRAVIRNTSDVIIDTATFSGDVATFASPVKVFEGYDIVLDNNGSSYTSTQGGVAEQTLSAISSDQNNYGVNWTAQTFTAISSHTLTAISLYIFKQGTPGTFAWSIRATSAGLPTGADLASGSMDGNTISTSPVWLDLSLGAGVALTAGTTYAIITRCTAGTSGNFIHWFQADTNVYSGGQKCTSVNSGSAWTAVSTADFVFIAGPYSSRAFPTTGTNILFNRGMETATTNEYVYNIVSVVSQTSNWISSGYIDCVTSSITPFALEDTPQKLTVKLIPKTTSPTLGYPSLRGFVIRVT